MHFDTCPNRKRTNTPTQAYSWCIPLSLSFLRQLIHTRTQTRSRWLYIYKRRYVDRYRREHMQSRVGCICGSRLWFGRRRGYGLTVLRTSWAQILLSAVFFWRFHHRLQTQTSQASLHCSTNSSVAQFSRILNTTSTSWQDIVNALFFASIPPLMSFTRYDIIAFADNAQVL